MSVVAQAPNNTQLYLQYQTQRNKSDSNASHRSYEPIRDESALDAELTSEEDASDDGASEDGASVNSEKKASFHAEFAGGSVHSEEEPEKKDGSVHSEEENDIIIADRGVNEDDRSESDASEASEAGKTSETEKSHEQVLIKDEADRHEARVLLVSKDKNEDGMEIKDRGICCEDEDDALKESASRKSSESSSTTNDSKKVAKVETRDIGDGIPSYVTPSPTAVFGEVPYHLLSTTSKDPRAIHIISHEVLLPDLTPEERELVSMALAGGVSSEMCIHEDTRDIVNTINEHKATTRIISSGNAGPSAYMTISDLPAAPTTYVVRSASNPYQIDGQLPPWVNTVYASNTVVVAAEGTRGISRKSKQSNATHKSHKKSNVTAKSNKSHKTEDSRQKSTRTVSVATKGTYSQYSKKAAGTSKGIRVKKNPCCGC